jgi:hypothetical protein
VRADGLGELRLARYSVNGLLEHRLVAVVAAGAAEPSSMSFTHHTGRSQTWGRARSMMRAQSTPVGRVPKARP